MMVALVLVLAIAVFVVREFWLGLAVIVGGDAVVVLLFRYVFGWPWSRIRHGREPAVGVSALSPPVGRNRKTTSPAPSAPAFARERLSDAAASDAPCTLSITLASARARRGLGEG
jgi:hypothetical protein